MKLKDTSDKSEYTNKMIQNVKFVKVLEYI